MSEHLPVIDIHVHLAGVGQGGTGCMVSDTKRRGLMFSLLQRMLGLGDAYDQGRLDQAYVERLERDLSAATAAGVVDAAVVFPHDYTYNDDGTPAAHQEMYVPNEYAIACARRAMESGAGGVSCWRLLPAMSVHPYRKDAVEQTQRFIGAGAVALKWLPSSQGMDPRDERCLPIYDLLATERIPLIVHTGSEHTVKVTRRDLADPQIMIPALRRGVTVVLSHCATKSGVFGPDHLPACIEMLREFPGCYGDISAFNCPGRSRWVGPLLAHADIVSKLVQGSDYPMPPVAMLSARQIGLRKARELARVGSFMQRDVLLKRARGFPDVVFTNAARILRPGSLERWGVTPRQAPAQPAPGGGPT